MNDLQDRLRSLGSVDALLHTKAGQSQTSAYGRDLTVEALRLALEEAREALLQGESHAGPDMVLARSQAILHRWSSPTLRPAINATGVILHTNLGRAPLSQAVLAAMREIGSGYSNLEYSIESGSRGSRYSHAEDLLCRLTGAEAGLVVNNNAGAVLLVLSAIARGGTVLISRGQLVEIGGGFRIPDVMAQSGARLIEVGTTNRTYVEDYAIAIDEDTVAIMRVHASNFRMDGFVYEPPLGDLVDLAHERDLLLLDDLGSGTLIDTTAFGLPHEPTIQESIDAGADLVTFSGDKLLGGPQGGFIVGRSELVSRVRAHPMTRALRVDKTTLAGIQANLLHYLKDEHAQAIPIWQMMGATPELITERGARLLEALGAQALGCEQMPGRSMIGGGSLPQESLPTTLLALPAGKTDSLASALRRADPAVIARVQDDRVVLDLRTVLPHQDEILVEVLQALLPG